jgi:hypothetical protein
VPKDSDDNAVVHAIRYMAHVHARPYLRDDTTWFHHTLNVLLELAYPSETLTPEAANFLAHIEKRNKQSTGSDFLKVSQTRGTSGGFATGDNHLIE